MPMTKGKKITAEALGLYKPKNELVLTADHPFLREVISFAKSRRYWKGSATELLREIGHSSTPPNTVTKILNKYDYDFFYKKRYCNSFLPRQPKKAD